MFHLDVPHFEEEGRVNPITPEDKLPTREYGMALDYLVFTCVDLAFTYRSQILLARRTQYPRKSWWMMGGRMVAGESPIAAAQRKASEEAGLSNLNPERFGYVGVYSTCFAFRQQEPMHHGSHSVNLTYQVVLTEAEKKQMKLNQEYSDWQWIEFDAVEQLLDFNNILDRALFTVVQMMSFEREAGI
ncbi:NUDIX hydrolase [Kovacikia minuta CCNUW1]|uniref:NUDIX hydrolase n=1 Tax=Kovacikia minuta TaxID=2931930 RepID=UPI001CCFA2BE|nr:NUDIX hydrolase [Kovacikia minuta]UBF24425.1 NUDIX hydrolase [Kovacikia minuta CCNUW1]